MISFTHAGRPQVKQRPRVGKNKVVYTPSRTVTFENEIGWTAKQHFKRPMMGELQIDIRLYFKNRRSIGDIDNYGKSVLDGLNKIAYLDDKQIRRQTIEMLYDSVERTEVTLDYYRG